MKGLVDVLLSRIVIAVGAAAGTYVLTAWPSVHASICSVSGVS